MGSEGNASRRRFLASAGIVALGATAGCLSDYDEILPTIGPDPDVGEWSTVRGDVRNTGYVDGEGSPPDALAPRWTFEASGVGSSSPAVGEGLVFFTSGGHVFAIDRSDGTVAWDAVEGTRSGLPTLSDGRLFVWTGRLYDELHAYRAGTGRERWTVELDDEYVMAPVAADGAVYAATDAGTLLALGARGGSERWRVETGGDVSVPAIHDGTAYVPARSELLALDTDTGEERWRVETGSPVGYVPAVADGAVFVAAGQLLALDADTGGERWRVDLGLTRWNSPAVGGDDDTVYVGSTVPGSGRPDGAVHAIDAATGAERWRTETADPVQHGVSVAAAGARRLVYAVDTGGTIHVLDGADGTGLSVVDAGGPVVGPAVRGDEVYLGATFGQLYAFGPGSGVEGR